MNYNRIYVLAAVLVIAFAGSANAASFGPFDDPLSPSTGEWSDSGNVGVVDLLDSSYFGGNYDVVNNIDFDGVYHIRPLPTSLAISTLLKRIRRRPPLLQPTITAIGVPGIT